MILHLFLLCITHRNGDIFLVFPKDLVENWIATFKVRDALRVSSLTLVSLTAVVSVKSPFFEMHFRSPFQMTF